MDYRTKKKLGALASSVGSIVTGATIAAVLHYNGMMTDDMVVIIVASTLGVVSHNIYSWLKDRAQRYDVVEILPPTSMRLQKEKPKIRV